MATNLAQFDKAIRAEVGVPAAAWLRQVTPTKLEIRFTGNPDAVATATNQGADQWCVETPTEVVFVGSALHARKLLWEAAAAVPTHPTTTPRTPQRKGFDWYARAD